MWGIVTWALRNLKNLHFIGLLLTKVYNVWAKKKYKGVMFDGTEYVLDLCFLKWHEEFGNFCSQGEK